MTGARGKGAAVTGRGTVTTAKVGIVGAGPAGLMVSHLLARAGIDSVVVDHRSRAEIERTVRAGILEPGSVALLTDTGVGDRVHRDGQRHDGIELRFGGASHRVDFRALTGASVWLYPQTDVFTDLADARQRDGGDVRFGVGDTRVLDVTSDRPVIRYTAAGGAEHEVRCRYLVGADGSHSLCRAAIPESVRRLQAIEYPFAWFGILAQASKSAQELVYTHSPRGFALVSQRSENLQRLYFQCPPDTDPAAWPAARIWDELQARVAGEDGFSLNEGPITDAGVLRFRSMVAEPVRYGRLLLAGDAAHTVPPTGAKGLNLALADARVLGEVLIRAVRTRDDDALDAYPARALARVWRCQQFSYWMTTMLHTLPGSAHFDLRRQVAELGSVVASTAGATYLAESYTGWSSRH